MSSGGGLPDAAIEQGDHELVRIKSEADLEPHIKDIAANLRFDSLNSSQTTPESMSEHEVRQLHSQYLKEHAHGAVFLLKGKNGHAEALVTVRTPPGAEQQAVVEKILVNGQSKLKTMLRPLVSHLYDQLSEMGYHRAIIFTDADTEARRGLIDALPPGRVSEFFQIVQKAAEDNDKPKAVLERRGK